MIGRKIPLRPGPASSAGGQTSRRKDPLAVFTFRVQIKGVTDSFFRSVGGVKAETEVLDHPEGGFNSGMRRLIGRTKWPNLVLKQGFCGPPFTLWKMHEKTLTAKAPRFDGTIWQLGPDMQDICGWQFWEGFICKWEGPDFDAAKNELAVETVEIAHEGLTLVTK